MLTFLGKIFTFLGWSRDDWKWIWTQLVAAMGLVTLGAVDVPMWVMFLFGVTMSTTAIHWVQFVCGVIFWVSGRMATSPLYGRNNFPPSSAGM
jgi:hypothetical protein